MNYAKESEVKAWTVLIADGGFTCIRNDAVLTVREDVAGLFVDCEDEGHKHYLDGQLDDGDVYIGFRLKAHNIRTSARAKALYWLGWCFGISNHVVVHKTK